MFSPSGKEKKDWSAAQYLNFSNERTRAVYDLITQITPHVTSPSPRIYDLGCGPGNSTMALLSAFSNAHITGIDSSPDMLARARLEVRSHTSKVNLEQGDISTFTASKSGADVLFSNAALQWLRSTSRISTIVRLFSSLRAGGVVAIQVPDNYHELSHALMRDTASMPDVPWTKFFESTRIGDLADAERPDLDPIEAPREWYDALVPHASSMNIWRTNYQHVLADAGAVVEWVKGTGLQPYMNRIKDEDAGNAFLKEYENKLKQAYPELGDGKVLLEYPRLFLVAVRK